MTNNKLELKIYRAKYKTFFGYGFILQEDVDIYLKKGLITNLYLDSLRNRGITTIFKKDLKFYLNMSHDKAFDDYHNYHECVANALIKDYEDGIIDDDIIFYD